MTLTWSTGADLDFIALTKELDAYLRSINGDTQDAFDPYNDVSQNPYTLVAYDEAVPVACGALKLHGDGTAEIKRMYVKPAYRRMGLAKQILEALEQRALTLGVHTLQLETNPAFTGAVALYQQIGFTQIEPFGPYRCLCTLCMGKVIRPNVETECTELA